MSTIAVTIAISIQTYSIYIFVNANWILGEKFQN